MKFQFAFTEKQDIFGKDFNSLLTYSAFFNKKVNLRNLT